MRTLLRFTDLYKKNFFRISVFILTTLIVISKVNAQTSVWTWVSGDNTQGNGPVYGTRGIPDAANKPGSRDRQCGWMDASGNCWIFGGWNSDFNFYNDLWKYTTATGQWTWVSGDNSSNKGGVYGTKGVADASNKPGARYGQASWTDAVGN